MITLSLLSQKSRFPTCAVLISKPLSVLQDSLALWFHCGFQFCVEKSKILKESKHTVRNQKGMDSSVWDNKQGDVLFVRRCERRTQTNLYCKVNNPQISSNAATKEKVKRCRFYSGRKTESLSNSRLKNYMHNNNSNTDIHLYITIGWSIWSKKVMSGSLYEEEM